MGSVHDEIAHKWGVKEILFGLRIAWSSTATYYDCSPQELLAMVTVRGVDGRKYACVDCAVFAALIDMMDNPRAHGLTFPLFVTDQTKMTEAQQARVKNLRASIDPYEGRAIQTWYHTCVAITRVGPLLAGQHRHQWLARYGSERNTYIGITDDAGVIVETLQFWVARQGENAKISGVW